jgi:NAD+ synthase (glutamine-hydrolysing)
MTNFTLQIINAYLLKIVLAQQNYHIGNFEANTQQIIAAIQHAKKDGAELIIFSELCVCGYPPRDFLEFDDFIDQSMAAVRKIAAEADTIGVLIGAPARNTKPEGKGLYNAAYFLYENEIKQVVHKTLLPTYDIFDEYRYFESAASWELINFKGKKWAVTLCEDIWDISDNPLYRMRPMDELMKQKPDIMVNLSASPFDYVHAAARKNIIALNVARYGLPMLYCNTVGSQTELVFDGGSIAMDANQNIIAELPYFEASLQTIEWLESGALVLGNHTPIAYHPAPILGATFAADLGIEQIHAALLLGIRDYFAKMSFTKAIVASSGGIDSAVVLALATEALGAENVRGLLLPSAFSSDHSITDAVALAQNLQHQYDIIPIKGVFNAYEDSLSQVFSGLAFSVAEENLQSRIRGAMVMALSNKFGSILLNTSNKSELATGYGTLYGDMAGGLGVLGDLYKMQVYALARYINRNKELIPQHIIDKAPSAELRPGQKDSDSLPDYAVLDAVLYQYIEKRKGPKELVAMGFDPVLITRILKLVNANEYKRNQFCPIIRVSPKAFGVGRRMPIVGKYLS